MSWAINLLICQGLLGAFDVLWHHEWRERLPSRPTAALEQKIHGVRSWLLSLFGLGVFAWGIRDYYSGMRLASHATHSATGA